MPIYEYQCRDCAHQFEIIQKVSDSALVDCPRCGAPKLRKLLSLTAFRLKGEGWYETDFKAANRRHVAGDHAEAPESAKSGDEGAGAAASSKSDASSDTAGTRAKEETKSEKSSSSGEKPADGGSQGKGRNGGGSAAGER